MEINWKAEQEKLKAKMQNDTIDRLVNLVDAYVDGTSKDGYQMTAHEKDALSDVIAKLNEIEYKEMLK